MERNLNQSQKDKAYVTALDFLHYHRKTKYNYGLLTDEAEVRSCLHSVGKVNFPKTDSKVIDYLWENQAQLTEEANLTEPEDLKQYFKDREVKALCGHPDIVMCINMFGELMEKLKVNQIKENRDVEILNSLMEVVKKERLKADEYGIRILIKRLYCRNINQDKYVFMNGDKKKTFLMKDIFTNKEIKPL